VTLGRHLLDFLQNQDDYFVVSGRWSQESVQLADPEVVPQQDASKLDIDYVRAETREYLRTHGERVRMSVLGSALSRTSRSILSRKRMKLKGAISAPPFLIDNDGFVYIDEKAAPVREEVQLEPRVFRPDFASESSA
jgi:hypothetical protein